MTSLRFTTRGRTNDWHRKPQQTSGQRLAAHGKVRPMEGDESFWERLGRIWRGERG